MARLSRVIQDNEKTTQTIVLSGRHRNMLIREAENNGISLSSQISIILSQYFKHQIDAAEKRT